MDTSRINDAILVSRQRHAQTVRAVFGSASFYERDVLGREAGRGDQLLQRLLAALAYRLVRRDHLNKHQQPVGWSRERKRR